MESRELQKDYSEVVEKMEIIYKLRDNFAYLPNKIQAWKDIIRWVHDENDLVRRLALKSLKVVFPHIPDKKLAQQDLHELTKDTNNIVRCGATYQLRAVFPNIPDKKQGWDDLIRLVEDKDGNVQMSAAHSLGYAFQHIIDKKMAYDNLHQMTKNIDIDVRWGVAVSLGVAFFHISNKELATHDIIQLMHDENIEVRIVAAESLVAAFSNIPNKEYAWNELHWLTRDDESVMRAIAAKSLGAVFQYISNKEQAWNDLHELTKDKDSYVRQGAAESVGAAFPNILDTKQAWEDLIRLTQDKDHDELFNVRISANYSLGRASIFKATEAENQENFRKDLEKSIEFFEKSIKEVSKDGFVFNPASFCLPFYRSFYAITFKKQDATLDIQKSLDEAKNAVKGSESKEKLLKVMEDLEKALKEAQKAKDLNSKKCDLNVIRMHFENAGNLLDTVKEKAPLAAEIVRKGMPVIETKIKELLSEIQDEARDICQQSKGTPVEEIACAANQEIKKWRIGDQEQMTCRVENLIFSLKSKIPFTPENKNIHDKIEEIKKETDITKQYEMLPILIALIPTIHTVHVGDNITSDIKNSGKNSPVVIKGDSKQNINETRSFGEEPVKKSSWIERLNSPATIAAFIFGLAIEIGTYIYPIPYSHYISVGIAVFVFVIVTILNKG